MYSRDMSKKVSTALREKQKRGELVGAAWAAYGYRKCADDPHRIEPDEETAPVVREIFHMRVQGMGYNKIARELNRRGIPAPSRYHYLKGDTKCARYAGVAWQPQVTSQILSSEVYLGHMVQGRCRRSVFQEKRSRAASEQDLVIVRNTHEPLVDEDTFRIVQEMAARQKAAYLEGVKKNEGLQKKPNILRKLIFCAECGKTMAYKGKVWDNGKKKLCYYSYVCPSHERDIESCHVKSIREDTLLEMLWELLKKQTDLAEKLGVKAAEIRSSAEWAAENAEAEREYNNARKNLERLRMLHDSLYPAYADEKALFILAGSIPNGVDKNIYAEITKRVHARGARVLMDADGEVFRLSLEAGPDIIKPNRVELEEYAGIDYRASGKELLKMARKLMEKGIHTAAVSMGKSGALFVKGGYEAVCPALSVKAHSTVGAGDAMVAALAYAWDQKLGDEETVKLCMAASAGAVTTVGTKPPAKDLVETLKEQVKIESVE